MILTIYSSGGVTIDGQVFDGTPIDLVNITCLSASNYTSLYDNVKNGVLKIKENGEDVGSIGDKGMLGYMSRLISLDQGLIGGEGKTCDYDSLSTDWENKT
jgi:hypothetical protein